MEFNPLSLSTLLLSTESWCCMEFNLFSLDLLFLSIDACCCFSFNIDVDNHPFFKLEELNIVPATSPFIKFHTLKPCVNITILIISKFHTLNSTTIHVPLLYNRWCNKLFPPFYNNCCNNLFLSFVAIIITNHFLSISTTTHVYLLYFNYYSCSSSLQVMQTLSSLSQLLFMWSYLLFATIVFLITTFHFVFVVSPFMFSFKLLIYQV